LAKYFFIILRTLADRRISAYLGLLSDAGSGT